jgi:hypothetical protein
VLKLRGRRYDTSTHSRTLQEPVDTEDELFRISRDLLGRTRIWERGVRLVGLGLQRLVHVDRARQLSLGFGGGDGVRPTQSAATGTSPPAGVTGRSRGSM